MLEPTETALTAAGSTQKEHGNARSMEEEDSCYAGDPLRLKIPLGNLFG